MVLQPLCLRSSVICKICDPKDHIIPYMCDSRHAPDTLFLIAEEDWRLYPDPEPDEKAGLSPSPPEPDSPCDDSVPDWGGPSLSPAPDEPEPSRFNVRGEWLGRFSPNLESWEEEPSDHSKATMAGKGYSHVADRWYVRTYKPNREEFGEPTETLCDLVRLATAAHRCQRGDIIWMAYECDSSQQRGGTCNQPVFGTQLLGISQRGAKWLQSEWPTWRTGHFDNVLREQIQEKCNFVRASYVFPSIGHFATHASGILKNDADRGTSWHEAWVQAGVRPKQKGDRVRSIHEWVMGKTVHKLRDVILGDEGEDLRWKTLWKGTGSPPEPVAGGNKKEKSASSSSSANIQSAEQTELAGSFDVTNVGHDVPLTERQKRARRAQLRDYAKRIFVTKSHQACLDWYTDHPTILFRQSPILYLKM